MSIMRSVGAAIATAIKTTVRAVARAAISGVKAIPGAIRLAGRAAVATAKVGGRAVAVGTGMVLSAADRLLGMFSRGGQELPEPEYQEVFSPSDEWLAEMESAHEAYEIGEIESSFADNPNAEIYRYVAAADDNARRKVDLSKLDPNVRSWAYKLVDAERVLLKRAGCDKMLKHIAGTKLIKGVAPVRPREVVLDFTRREQSTFELADTFGPGTEMRMAM